jgi:hypothetical protein
MPEHFTLRSHPLIDLMHGGALMLVPAGVIFFAAKLGIPRHSRLELLVAFFLLPFALGAVVGEFFPVPSLIRLHLLRSESFLVLYSMVLVQIYGGRILLSAESRSPAAIWLLGVPAVLWPFDGFVLPVLLLTGILVVLDPEARLERLCRYMAQSWVARVVAVLAILAAAITEVRLLSGLSSPGLIVALVAVVGFLAACGVDLPALGARPTKLALAACWLVLMAVAVGSVPKGSRLWNPVIAPGPADLAWREVQQWAKANTRQDARFLVPPVPGGFRVLSERVSWGEWKDGSLIYTFPPLADEWIRRMRAIGVRPEPFVGSYERMQNDYKEQSWVHLAGVARAEKIDYIVQYRDVPYSIPRVFANARFAVYRVPN